jgi:Arc/MetJ-type ribon-helix-helix transcriptional regulator
MVLSLRREVQQFIDEQVRAGRFPTPEAVVEAAIAEFSDTTAEFQLTAADIAAINKAEAQADRGEGTDLDEFRVQIGKRFVGN